MPLQNTSSKHNVTLQTLKKRLQFPLPKLKFYKINPNPSHVNPKLHNQTKPLTDLIKKIENFERNSIKNPSFSKEKLSIPTFQRSPSKAKELK